MFIIQDAIIFLQNNYCFASPTDSGFFFVVIVTMDATNLDCRMVKSLYPENDSMVMAQVTKIQEDGVTFSLLEFNNREVRIVVANDSDCLARSKVGRIEPLKVMFVDKTFDYIAVKRSGTTFDERMKCEQLYNKRKHVHSVLHSIADEHDIDLEVYSSFKAFIGFFFFSFLF